MPQNVLTEIKKLSEEYLDKGTLEKEVQFNNRLQKSKELIESEIATYQDKIIESDNGIKNLYLDKVKGVLTEDDFINLSKELHRDKRKYESLISQSQDQLSDIEQKLTLSTSRRKTIENYINIDSLNHEIVDTLIDFIVVGKKDPETKEIPIEINWNF